MAGYRFLALSGALADADFLQRNLGIGEFVLVEVQPLDDGLAPLHIVLGRVDAVEGDDLAVAIIDDRKFARSRVAANDIAVMAGRQADGLQLQIILIRYSASSPNMSSAATLAWSLAFWTDSSRIIAPSA